MYAGLQVQQLQLTQTQMGLTQTQTGLTLLALPVKRSELVRWMCEKQGELILVAAVHCGRMSISVAEYCSCSCFGVESVHRQILCSEAYFCAMKNTCPVTCMSLQLGVWR